MEKEEKALTNSLRELGVKPGHRSYVPTAHQCFYNLTLKPLP